MMDPLLFTAVRCSAVPLHMNPFLHKIQTVYARCTSVDSILDMMAGPDSRTKPHLSGHYKPPAVSLSASYHMLCTSVCVCYWWHDTSIFVRFAPFGPLLA
jgi:hypothetical protein